MEEVELWPRFGFNEKLSLNYLQPSKLFQSSIMWNTIVKARYQFFAKEVKRIQYDQPRVVKLL